MTMHVAMHNAEQMLRMFSSMDSQDRRNRAELAVN